MVTYKGCLCSREFDARVKRVGKRDYTETGKILQAKTERSMRDLKNAVSKKKGRSKVK